MKKKINENIAGVRHTSNLKTKKGITLIALVITIIVLLILAGVTVATITGENGLLSKAQLAKERTLDAEQDEKDKLSLYEDELSNYSNTDRGTVTLTDEQYQGIINRLNKLESNSYENYSTREQIVGCWINGKPIYRKVLTGLSVSTKANNWNEVNTGILNMDYPISLTCMRKNVKQIYAGLRFGVANTTGKITFLINDTDTVEGFILEYTKTTDNENSFTTSMVGIYTEQ